MSTCLHGVSFGRHCSAPARQRGAGADSHNHHCLMHAFCASQMESSQVQGLAFARHELTAQPPASSGAAMPSVARRLDELSRLVSDPLLEPLFRYCPGCCVLKMMQFHETHTDAQLCCICMHAADFVPAKRWGQACMASKAPRLPAPHQC